MATIPANARLVSATFQFGGDTYTEHVLSYQFAPTNTTANYVDVSGTTHHVAGDSDWALNLDLLQDYSATGLARYAFDHEGDDITVTIVDGPTTWTAVLVIVAGAIGAAGKTLPTTQVSFPSTKPVPTATA